MRNVVYIATSLDGCISAPDGSLAWLETVPNPENDDLGFADFIARIDVVIMGRVTFETVLGFGTDWPYSVPGIVLSSTLASVPDGFSEHVRIASGSPHEIIALASGLGFESAYIDGGRTIQRFLAEDLVDELIITEIPIILGGGQKLFGPLDQHLELDLVSTETLLGQMVKRHYRRVRGPLIQAGKDRFGQES